MKKKRSRITGTDSKLKAIANFASFLLTKPGMALLMRVIRKQAYKRGILKEDTVDYTTWLARKTDTQKLQQEFSTIYPTLTDKPTFSIIIAANGDAGLLHSTIQSITAQLYPHWEIIIVGNDNDINKLITDTLKNDTRIKAITSGKETTVAGCYNTALRNATGEYVAFLRAGSQLTINCLFEFATHINEQPRDCIIYSDEDITDEAGKFADPFFKPGWSPASFLTRNYIGDAFFIETGTALSLQLRDGFEGSELFDLLLRATERTDGIGRIPMVLFHCMKKAQSATTKKAIADALQRRRTPATISDVAGMLGIYQVRYEVSAIDKVSIIIPTKDQAGMLKVAIDSIISKTTYPDYEIILLNNNSSTQEFYSLVKEYNARYPDKFRCIDAHFPFNFPKLMNLGVAHSKGKYLLLLNNDIEVVNGDWIARMVAYAQHADTGAVGVKLLYPNNTIQHAGIVLGINGDTGHVFAHMPHEAPGYHGCATTATNYAAVTGACLMCRKEVYNEVGGMNETLAVEYNDIDLCLRFLRHGYYNVFIPVELYHHESATRGHPFRSKASWQRHDDELRLFKNKWQQYITNDPYYNPNLTLDTLDYRMKL